MPDTIQLQREILQMSPPSFGQMFRDRVTESRDKVAFLYPDRVPTGPNRWTPMTWGQMRAEVDLLAAGLLALGVGYEDRVAIAATTRIEWVLADLAIMCAAGAVTTIYPNTRSEDMHYILADSGSMVLVCENWEQVAKTLEFDDLTTQLRRIIVIDDDRTGAQRDDERVLSWHELRELGRTQLATQPDCVDEAIAATGPDSLATIIYTSGTTGRPKGVELVHRCWTYEGMALKTTGLAEPYYVQYLWLPLAHVFGKDLIACQIAIGFASAIDGRIDRIVQGLAETKPHFMCGAPRIFEKVRSAVITSTSGSVKSRIARWAFSVGRDSRDYRLGQRPMPAVLAVKYRIADLLVFRTLKAKLGGNIEFFISGSAKLNSQVQRWFYSAGITVWEGYGSTELTAIASVDDHRDPHLGTVGRPTPGIECRISDEGEVLFRGPIVTRGYHNDPEHTAEVLDADGWFHTGDLGELDDDGYLTIKDRIKDLMKTSGGKYVAPQKVEGAIVAAIPYISQAVAVGDNHKYITAIIELDHDLLMKWGQRHGHPDASYAELSQLPEIRASIERQMAKVNENLERWETVKKFAILDHPLGTAEGTTTANMKIRRHQVAAKYHDLIEAMYPSEDKVEQ